MSDSDRWGPDVGVYKVEREERRQQVWAWSVSKEHTLHRMLQRFSFWPRECEFVVKRNASCATHRETLLLYQPVIRTPTIPTSDSERICPVRSLSNLWGFYGITEIPVCFGSQLSTETGRKSRPIKWTLYFIIHQKQSEITPQRLASRLSLTHSHRT